jgi:hypothetical protein
MTKICICLCVYNNEFGLPYVLNNILQIEKIFTDDCKILAFYDTSIDKSLSILNSHNEKYGNLEIIINQNTKSSSRTENIAYARNNLLNKLREKYSDVPYFIMMDSNDYSCIGNININVLKKAFERKDEWDAISFDREAGYYDHWALSFDPFIYSFFHFSNWRKAVEIMRAYFNKLMNHYKTNKPDQLISVYSAFNGFSIYKTEKFLNCSYSSNINIKLFPLNTLKKQLEITKCRIVNNITNDCEHRHFHLEGILKYNAKIRICTDFLFNKFENPPKNLKGPA